MALLLSLAAAAWQFEVYRRSGALQPLLLRQLGMLLWILATDFFLIALIPVSLSALLSTFRWPRLGTAVFLVAIWGIMVWTAADMRVHLLTGKHLSFYLPYLTQPDVGEWAGGTGELVRAGAMLTATCALTTLVIWIYRWSLQRTLQRGATWRRRTGWTIATVLLTLGIVGRASLPAAAAHDNALEKALVTMQQSAAIHQEQRIASSPFGTAFSREFQPVLEEIHERLFTPTSLPAPGPLTTDQPPDVLLIILESWRWNSLTPDRMPTLHALGARGLVARHHYSPSNRSEMGLFALFYGRLPSLYDQTLDRSLPPDLCQIFRQWGYDSVYVSGMQHARFRRMEAYINHPQAFDEVVILSQRDWANELEDPGWPQRDRAVIEHLRSRLNHNNRKPLFAVAFLGATHFPYRYPPEFLRNQPVSPDSDFWAGGMSRETHEQLLKNRYANAAAFLDDEVGRLIASLDLSRTIVLVTGDHGESLWDDGILSHGTRPSEIQCRVPLLALGRNVPRRQIDVPTTHLDVLPTLANAVAGDPPFAWTEGADLRRPGLESRPVLLTFPPPQPGPQELALFVPEGRMLIRLMDRKPVARVLGFVGEDGVINPALTPHPDQVGAWVQRWRDALDRRLE